MFPIPFNFPFRKKDGSIVSLSKAIEDGGGYTLPTASNTTKGGVKVGAGLTMDGETLENSNPTPYTLPAASDETLGGVKVGTGLEIDENGVLSTSGGGGGLSYVDVTISSAVGGGMFATAPFQPPTDLVGKRVVNGVVLEGTSGYGNIYLVGITRMSDPVTANDWIYPLLYNYGNASTSSTITKIRIFYT